MAADTQAEPGQARAAPRAAAGYAMVLPPGWRRIPVRQGTAEAIKEILDEVVGRVGSSGDREKLVRARVEIQGRLTTMAARARENGGVDLYLPVEYVHGIAVPASFLVSEGAPGGLSDGSRDEIVAALAAADDSATLVEVDGVTGVRTELVAPPDPANDVPLASRRVDYVLPLPGPGCRWLMVVFSTLGDSDPEGEFAGILVQLFDAIMSTFQWTPATEA
jgi:hypothetical protein